MVPEQPLGEKVGAELGVRRGTSTSSRVQGRTVKQMPCTVQGLRQKLDERWLPKDPCFACHSSVDGFV